MRVQILIETGPGSTAHAVALLRATADLLEGVPVTPAHEPPRLPLDPLASDGGEAEESDAANARLARIAAAQGVPVPRLIEEARAWISQHARIQP